MAFLAAVKRPAELTSEAREVLGVPDTRSGRSSLIRAARSLEARGLIRITSVPSPNGGRAKLAIEIVDGAERELTAAELNQARGDYG